MMPGNFGNVGGFGGGGGDGFGMDQSAAKQMAALQAASLAKAGNRSAPGGTSVPYFGGMGVGQPRPEQQPDNSPFGALHDFQSPAHHPTPNPMQPNSAQMLLQQQQQQQLIQQQKKRNWLKGLANLMASRNTPLPSNLTGIPNPPGSEMNTSVWRSLEVVDLGTVRLAGKDLDLYKLWVVVVNNGGGSKMSQSSMWPAVLQYFQMPDQYPNSQGQMQPVANVLATYYNAILGPFEEVYKKGFLSQQQQGGMMQGRNPSMSGPSGTPQMRPDVGGMPGQMGGMQGLPGGMPNASMMGMGQPMPSSSSQAMDSPMSGVGPFSAPSVPQTPRLSSHLSGGLPGNSSGLGLPSNPDTLLGTPAITRDRSLSANPGFPFPSSVHDSVTPDVDMERKRKMQEMGEVDAKRPKLGSEGPDPRHSMSLERSSVPPIPPLAGHSAAAAAPPAAPVRRQKQPSRRKIEYVPYAREVESAGGRDLEAIQREYEHAARRPRKDMNDWGQVDLVALTMSLRSRIATELSYALTTFTILTVMQGGQKGTAFPIVQTPDLFEELLDLLEDVAFDGEEEDEVDAPVPDSIMTHRELVNGLLEDGSRPFAALEPKQGKKDPNIGPKPRAGELILTIVNIIRNLSITTDNQEFMAKNHRMLTHLLRLSNLVPETDGLPSPLCPHLSLSDVLTIRKDIVYTLVNVAGFVDLASTSKHRPQVLRNVRRAFELLSSTLCDPVEAVSPFACMLQSGIPPAMHQPKPPSLADSSLEAFTRLVQPDENRHVVAQAVPSEWLWTLMEALVHRLPISDHDFQVVMRDVWLGYIEKVIMAIYCIAFLAPPTLKRRVRSDRALGFTKVLVRLVKKFTIYSPADVRMYFIISVRRAIEAMRLIDLAEDSFDAGQSTMPTLTFGMGYGEHGESRVEKGSGLLSGYQEEITWNLMTQREMDDLMFQELESLVRVGY